MSGGTGPIHHFFPKIKKPEKVGFSEFYSNNLPKPEKSGKKKKIETVDNDLLVENQKLQLQLKEAHVLIEKLSKENLKYKNDLISLKKLYNASCRSYVQKDFKIKLLEKNSVIETETNSVVMKETNSEKKLTYGNYTSIFDEQTLVELRSLSGIKRNDSTFVLICMRKLYENSLSTLYLKSASGNYNDKTMISPGKRQIIDSIMLERLSNEATNDEDAYIRYLRLNDLINNAINNISRKVHY